MAALLCLAAVAGVRADDFAALRAEAAGRTVRLAPGTQLEALVVSDYRSQNMELNPNVSWDKVDLGENLRTAYVESPDGRYGFRLRFAGIYENRLERGDRVRLDLGGCSLTGETDPERYTVDGLCAANVEVLERGVALPAKERRIADLDKPLKVAVMGCVVNGPGESRQADIGISLPGSGESPVAPVYVRREKVCALKGDDMQARFHAMIEEFVQTTYGASSRGQSDN